MNKSVEFFFSFLILILAAMWVCRGRKMNLQRITMHSFCSTCISTVFPTLFRVASKAFATIFMSLILPSFHKNELSFPPFFARFSCAFQPSFPSFPVFSFPVWFPSWAIFRWHFLLPPCWRVGRRKRKNGTCARYILCIVCAPHSLSDRQGCIYEHFHSRLCMKRIDSLLSLKSCSFLWRAYISLERRKK